MIGKNTLEVQEDVEEENELNELIQNARKKLGK